MNADRRGSRVLPLLAALALMTAAAGCGGSDEPDKAGRDKADKAKGGQVTRDALGARPDPGGATGQTLGLSRVVIPPGGKVPLHYHAGTQVAFVDKGVLTYTVVRGAVDVMRGPAGKPTIVRRIADGQTAAINAGEWIVERRTDVHRAENRGEGKVVVLLATLLRNDAPPANPVAHAER